MPPPAFSRFFTHYPVWRLAARLAQLNNVLHMEQAAILRMPRKDRKAAKQRIADVEERITEMSTVLQRMHRDKEKAEKLGPPPAHRSRPKPPLEEPIEEEEGEPTGGAVDEEDEEAYPEERRGYVSSPKSSRPTSGGVDDKEVEEESEPEPEPEPEP